MEFLFYLGITMLPLSDDFFCPCFFQFAHLAIQVLSLFLCERAYKIPLMQM